MSKLMICPAGTDVYIKPNIPATVHEVSIRQGSILYNCRFYSGDNFNFVWLTEADFTPISGEKRQEIGFKRHQ